MIGHLDASRSFNSWIFTEKRIQHVVLILALVLAIIALSGDDKRATPSSPVLPASISYTGVTIYLQAVEPNYGAGATVEFDLDGDFVADDATVADDQGIFTIQLDVPSPVVLNSRAVSPGGGTTPWYPTSTTQLSPSPSRPSLVPVRLSGNGPVNPCGCSPCGGSAAGRAELLGHVITPSVAGVQLTDGQSRVRIPILAFDDDKAPTPPDDLGSVSASMPAIVAGGGEVGGPFELFNVSQTSWGGPYGGSWTSTGDLRIVQDSVTTGRLITADLRMFEISRPQPTDPNWTLPGGFFSSLTLDESLKRWTLTHYSGVVYTVFQARTGTPGYLIEIEDRNGNTTEFTRDYSSFLTGITTEYDQGITLAYDPTTDLLSTVTDPIGRVWTFTYDANDRLVSVGSPATDFVAVGPGDEVTDSNLYSKLVHDGRVTTLTYPPLSDPNRNWVLAAYDGRLPTAGKRFEFQRDLAGAVTQVDINNGSIHIEKLDAGGIYSPSPLPPLDAGNFVVRVTDREGNVCDYELHGTGSPVNGKGKHGLRRMTCWTESGKGGTSLRQGEPDYYETRWLHDGDCKRPIQVARPFSDADHAGIAFDGNQMPINWPTTTFTYNSNRQVTRKVLSDGGTDAIIHEATYDTNANFAVMLTCTDPRAFSTNPIYAGLSFVHSYTYDANGNRLSATAPTVTRGASHTPVSTWTYDPEGQVTSFTDPNGNRTSYSYFATTTVAGVDINEQGGHAGYLASITRGAAGSADTVTNLTTTYAVNGLGMVTQTIDPNGYSHTTEFNDLGEVIRVLPPMVTLYDSTFAQYETLFYYDGAGNRVLERRRNVDLDGTLLPNSWVDQSTTFDDIGNVLSVRREADSVDANDVSKRFAYDNNDQLIAVERPEGNRSFFVYDERGLLLRNFYGIAAGSSILDGYPVSKSDTTLGGGVAHVGYVEPTYDARRNVTDFRDGRGNNWTRVYDFADRCIANRDPEGNGSVEEYDVASHAINREAGAVSAAGVVTTVLSRTYTRYDELGRRYQSVQDLDLGSNERLVVDPASGTGNPGRLTTHDPGNRTSLVTDAMGNATQFEYDAANRIERSIDAMNNRVDRIYDGNSNVIQIVETELPDTGAWNNRKLYYTTFDFDQLNRRTALHVRGEGAAIDHATRYAYDSRGNVRMVTDAEGKVYVTSLDDLDRVTSQQRYDGDPFSGSPTELQRCEFSYDANGRKMEDISWADVADPTTRQITRYGYDPLDRRVRSVYPDSDDPTSGAGLGTDGIYDRIEVVHDANSNVVQVKDRREVQFDCSFDGANRLEETVITLSGSVAGVTKRTYGYDNLNRMVEATNDYARVALEYDPLGRQTAEEQSLNLAGTGHTAGWFFPIRCERTYDKQGNNTGCTVLDGATVDMEVGQTFDSLNRVATIDAKLFYLPSTWQNVVWFDYFGPTRTTRTNFGNGTFNHVTYDVKRRVLYHDWLTYWGAYLMATDHAYDRVDNPLNERILHDSSLYDNFGYNARYEFTGANYRQATATDYRSFAGSYQDTFTYDDTLNREASDSGDPFDNEANLAHSYTADDANQYTAIGSFSPVHDRAGNMTSLQSVPATGAGAGALTTIAATWDAFNRVHKADTGTMSEHYRFDPFDRRIARYRESGGTITQGRRFIYCDWSVVEERTFNASATESSPSSTMERTVVHGPGLDAPVLCVKDADGDRSLSTGYNQPGAGNDAQFFYVRDRMGSVVALFNASSSIDTLEFYRYDAFGHATVLPIVDNNGNGIEDTPYDLTDNNVSMLIARLSDPSAGRKSEYGNEWLFTSRRMDRATGLYHHRHRAYSKEMGRFISADTIPARNLFAYVENRPRWARDPLGRELVVVHNPHSTAVGDFDVTGHGEIFDAIDAIKSDDFLAEQGLRVTKNENNYQIGMLRNPENRAAVLNALVGHFKKAGFNSAQAAQLARAVLNMQFQFGLGKHNGDEVWLENVRRYTFGWGPTIRTQFIHDHFDRLARPEGDASGSDVPEDQAADCAEDGNEEDVHPDATIREAAATDGGSGQ